MKIKWISLTLFLAFMSCGYIASDNGISFDGHVFFRKIQPNMMYHFKKWDCNKKRRADFHDKDVAGMKFDFLMNDPLAELPGAFSDDGRYISYVYAESKYNPDSLKGTLWIIDTETKQREQITKQNQIKVFHLHDWCSVQNKIVFPGYYNESFKEKVDLYTVDIKTKKIEQLTSFDKGKYVITPSWSYDGRYIAFVVGKIGECKKDIFLMDYQTREMENLTHSENFEEDFPMWTSDNEILYFIRWNEKIDHGKASIYRIDLKARERKAEIAIPWENRIEEPSNIKEIKYSLISPTMSKKGDLILNYYRQLIIPGMQFKLMIIDELNLPWNGYPILSPVGDKLIVPSYRKKYSNDRFSTTDIWIADISVLVENIKSKKWTSKWFAIDRDGTKWRVWNGVDKQQ